MRLAKWIIACGAIIGSVATASARMNGGGGGESSCQHCDAHITGGIDFPTVVYTCEVTRWLGRKECQTSLLNHKCTESGDYCGYFVPSPNPVIA